MKNIRLAVLALFGLMLASSVLASDAVKKNIEQFQKSGRFFQNVSPFEQNTAKSANELISLGVSEEVLLKGTALFLRNDSEKSLKADLSAYVKMQLPVGEEGIIEVLLYEQSIFTDDAKIYTSDNPDLSIPFPQLKFYRGVVVGEEHSLVSLVIGDSEINGLVSYGPDTYVLGKIENSQDNIHIWYRDNDILLDETFSCEAIASEEHEQDYKPTTFGATKTTRCVRVRVELDTDLVNDFSSSNAAISYTSSLFNQVVALFDNDDIDIAVSEIFAWTGSSPYSGSLGNKLNQMTNNSPGSDITTLLTRSDIGGIAYLSGICSSTFGVSVSGVFGFFNNIPTYSWDVNVTAHELGHNLSSPHTHACAWNGNNTPIDGCGAQAGFSEGCTGPIPSGGGTIMSYCHLLSTGVNFNLGFGPQPTSRMTNYVNSRSCLETDCVSVDPGSCENESASLAISLDDYPTETTWQVTDGSGSILFSGGPYANNQQFTTVGESLCLEAGCYTLTFFDEFGDGICCAEGNGSYSLTDASGIVLASGGEFADSETNQFCIGDIVVPCFDVNFNDYNISSYIPPRDQGTFTIQEAGTGIFLQDNSLKYIPINYDVTSATVLEFEFQSTDQGSIHAIAMENNSSLTLQRLFKLYGTFNNNNIISDFDTYSGTSLQSFTIPIGNYYTGNNLDLVVLSANVNGSPGNNAYFRNIKLYEGNSCTSAASIEAISSFETESDFVLFPNPAKSQVELLSKGGVEIHSLQVYSLTGSLLEQKIVNGPRVNIDLQNRSKGIYLVRWKDELGIGHQQKLVKTE
ncbi:MAG: M12 family metallo-peptidase [Bacteroidota bacterium]